jgi:hypothetical protein
MKTSLLDICWYFNNKLLNPNPNIKIRITDNTTSCTFLEVDQDLEGEYMCKATSTSGTHVTKARLHVHGTPFYLHTIDSDRNILYDFCKLGLN